MIWVAICSKGKVAFEFIEESINQQSYLALLKRHFPHEGDKKLGENRWRF